MPALSKHQIFSADDVIANKVEMKEWGGYVRVKKLSLGEMIEFDKRNRVIVEKYKEDDNLAHVELMILVIRMTCVDDEGKLIFPSDADADELRNKSIECLNRLSAAASELNFVLKKDYIENEAKN